MQSTCICCTCHNYALFQYYFIMSHLSHHYSSTLTLPLPDRPKLSTLLFYSVLHQTILLVKGEPLGGKGLTGPHLVVVEATVQVDLCIL